MDVNEITISWRARVPTVNWLDQPREFSWLKLYFNVNYYGTYPIRFFAQDLVRNYALGSLKESGFVSGRATFAGQRFQTHLQRAQT